MIREYLAQHPRIVKLCFSHRTEWYAHEMPIKNIRFDPVVILTDQNGQVPAYFLPWNSETGFYIDLPMNISATDPKLFITSELSGCFVGVQKIRDVIRVRHYNLKYNENLNIDNFRAYDTERSRTHWLIPDRGNNVAIFEASGIPFEQYAGYNAFHSAFMWGEYEQNQWRFFYLTPQGEVRPFAFE